jgi:hypothetical protein
MSEDTVKAMKIRSRLFKFDLRIYEFLDIFIAEHFFLDKIERVFDFIVNLTVYLRSSKVSTSILISRVNQHHICRASFILTKLNDIARSDLARFDQSHLPSMTIESFVESFVQTFVIISSLTF